MTELSYKFDTHDITEISYKLDTHDSTEISYKVIISISDLQQVTCCQPLINVNTIYGISVISWVLGLLQQGITQS
jgi:hypothetical protein